MKGMFTFAICGVLLTGIAAVAYADIKRYTYTYDIAEVEWQLLNWTAAWRNTTTPAGPFTLDRMAYSREARQISVYLKGDTSLDTQDNLDKSISQLVSLFSERFRPNFDPAKDMVVYYDLRSAEDKDNPAYIEYRNGAFSRGKENPAASDFPLKVTVPY